VGQADYRSAGAWRTAHRHPLVRRVNHWLNVVLVVMLIGTGLNIFGAHPALYLGQYGSEFDQPVLSIYAVNGRGVTTIGSHHYDTTGLLGFSNGHSAAFPSWATIPSYRDLATARNWHFALAWLLIINGLVFWVESLRRRHIQRDLLPTRSELSPRHVLRDIADHARLRFPEGEDSNRYHILQKTAYLSVVAILIPMMIVTGLSMSPGASAVAPWIVDLLGGRQSARTLHFITMWALIGFIIAHLAAVALAGVGNQLRSMITGRWRFRADGAWAGGAPAPTTLAEDVR